MNVGPSRNSARPGGSSRPGRRPSSVNVDPSTKGFTGSGHARTRRLVMPFVVSNVIIITISVAISLASLLFTSTTLVALPGSVAQAFLVINGGAIAGSGQVISAVPLLPALCVWLLTAKTTYSLVKMKASIRDLGIILTVAVGIPLLLTLTATAMLWSASMVFAMGIPSIATFGRVVVLHGSAVLVGMGPRLWGALARRYSVPEAWVSAAYAALKLLGLWLVAGFVLVVAMTMVRWQVVGHPLVAIGYVPNAAIGGAAVVLGADFRVGESWVSLFSAHPGILPPVQWLVAMPEEVHPAAGFLMVVAFLIALFVLKNMPEYGLAVAPFTAIGMGILLYLSSGQVGVLGYVGSTWWLAVLLAAVYPAAIGLGGVVLRVLGGKNARSGVDASAEAPETTPESSSPADASSGRAGDPSATRVADSGDGADTDPGPHDGVRDGVEDTVDDAAADESEHVGSEDVPSDEPSGSTLNAEDKASAEDTVVAGSSADTDIRTATVGEGDIAEGGSSSSTPDRRSGEGHGDRGHEQDSDAEEKESDTGGTPARGHESSEAGDRGGQWDETSVIEQGKVTEDDDANIPHAAVDPHGIGDEQRSSDSPREKNAGGSSRLWVGDTSPSDDGSGQ